MKTIIALAAAACACACAAPGAAGQDPHPTFTVGTATAQRGQKAYGALKVPAGSDAGYDIPVVVIHGARPGPVLAVASGAHGTEYASIIAVEMLIDSVKPDDVAGTLILLPLINVPSFEHITPHVNPTDNKSMNRYYPGNPTGTQTDRASYAITKEVVERCDHLIDLHGGDLDENLRPYSYWTVTGNQKQDEFSRGMVLAFGLDHIIISADRPKDPNAARFLENAASTRGKPSFTAEALPAVTVPSGRTIGFSFASASMLVARGCSSLSTIIGSPLRCGISTGTISAASRPFAWAAAARCWLRSAKASWSSRLIWNSCATFSPVLGIVSSP